MISKARRASSLLICLGLGLGLASPAFGWAERGHAIIARVAARLVMMNAGADAAKLGPFLANESMLAHVANIPDIKWRSDSADVIALNGPTHYIDLEYLSPDLRFDNFPKTIAELEERLRHNCALPAAVEAKNNTCANANDPQKPLTSSSAGTVPWRIRQLHGMMRDSFAAASVATSGSKEFTKAIDDALLYGGLMAHFVGDIANPHHTSSDHDGYAIGQGGVHVYFEAEVVSALDLLLEPNVFGWAQRRRPFVALAQHIPASSKDTWSSDPFAVSLAMLLDSHGRMDALNDLDRRFALLKPSIVDHGMKVPGSRRPAAEVAPEFREFIVERLALGADSLSALWLAAWRAGGKPDLSAYKKPGQYPLAPAFVPPDYLGTPK